MSRPPDSHQPLGPRPQALAPLPLPEIAAAAGASVTPGRDDGDSGASTVVTGVTLSSPEVRPGDLFLALPGSRTHGADFASEAAVAGASAILTDPAGAQIIARQQPAAGLPLIIRSDPRSVIGVVAAEIYRNPTRDMQVIGITGTSGKTTTSYLTEAALAASGRTVGLVGTVGARIAGGPIPSALTTPEAPALQALFAVMRERGVDTVVIEVSSHALALGRVDGTRFAVGAFTNLSQDHLDFHGDMEHYFAAKKLLFDGRASAEVVVIDDEYGQRLSVERPRAATVTTRPDQHADWTATTTSADLGTQQVHIDGPAGLRLDTTIHLPGSFNVANAATAVACAAAVGVDARRAALGLAGVGVPGRMQRVDRGQPYLAVVDYAHKPAAVEAVLAAVRPYASGRVIVVLGAGGDRDHGKRPMMGRAAAAGADIVIVTDDNPRTESPATIRAQILAGAREGAGGAEVLEIGDRREAIASAVGLARAGDVIVLAGKGHEQGQEVAGVVHHFSDVEELTAALDRAAPGAATPSDGGRP